MPITQLFSPGSPRALMVGCICPVEENRGGWGEPGGDLPRYWIREGCPLHRHPEETP